MKIFKLKGFFLTLFFSTCSSAMSQDTSPLKEEKVTPQENVTHDLVSLPDSKEIFAHYPLYQREEGTSGFQPLTYADQIFLRDKSSVTKIIWKGPESILSYLQEGPTYDVVEVHLNFEQDELTNEFFDAVLNLSPKVLTILNNSKGLAQGFTMNMLTNHVNFTTLEELNFGYCYKLQPFFQNREVAAKIRRLSWGALCPDTIQDAVPEELANLSDVKELNFGKVLVGENSAIVVDRLKLVLANKSDLEVFAADFMWIDLLQWLDLIPPSLSLKIMDVSGVYFKKGSASIEEKCAAEAEIFVNLKQQEELKTFKLVHYRSDDWQNFGNSLISYLSTTIYLRHLYLVGLTLTSTQWQNLGIGLGHHRQLQTLVITQSNMDSTATPFLSTCLINNHSLTKLSLSDNRQLAPLDGVLLLMSISSKHLIHMDMDHCLDVSRAKQALVNLVGKQHELENLSILSDHIDVDDVIDLIKARNAMSSYLKLYIGSQTTQEQLRQSLAPIILEKIRIGEILPQGGIVTVNVVSYNSPHLQNYLFFSHRTKARIILCLNPLNSLVPINADNSQTKIQVPHDSSHSIQTIDENSVSAMAMSSPSSASPLSDVYSWYNPLAYAYNPFNLLWKR